MKNLKFYPRSVSARLLALTLLLALSSFGITAQTTNKTPVDGMTPSGLTPGAPTGTYALSGFDNINLFNGNLNFRLPLLSIGGRGDALATSILALNTKSWKVKHTHRVMPNGDELDTYSPTQNNCMGGDSGYNPGKLTGRRMGIFTTHDFSCGTRYRHVLTRFTFTLPDGTEFELRDTQTGGQPLGISGFACNSGPSRGTVFTTADGSAATFISDAPVTEVGTLTLGCGGVSATGVLILRDGTRYRIDTSKITSITDRNGNQIRFTYDSFGRVTSATDSINRQVTFNYDVVDVQPYGLSDQIIYKGFGGAQRIIRISKAPLANALRPNSGYSVQTLQQLFPELNNSSPTLTHNPTLVTKLWLPNSDGSGQHHQFYQFFYNSYGELARVELPTGGAVEYDSTPGSGVIFACQFCDGPQIYRRVIERRVYEDGSILKGKTTYSAIASTPFDPEPWTTTVTVDERDANNVRLARRKHYFNGSGFASLFNEDSKAIYTAWDEARETKTESLDANGTTIWQRVETTFQQRAPVAWWPAWYGSSNKEPSNDPRLVTTITTLVDTNQQKKQTSINPQNGTVGYDQFNNQTDVWEYDFGAGAPGPLLRRTHTDYLQVNPVNGVNYTTTSTHLRSLPSQVQIFDAAGVERARKTFEYDNYVFDSNHAGLIDRPSISGFDASFSTSFTRRGNATACTKFLLVNGAVTGSITTFSQFDIAGNVVKSIDGRGFATTFDFSDRYGAPDGNARLNSAPLELSSAGKVSYAFATNVTNSLAQTSYVQLDYYLAKPVDGEDLNGVVASGFYNDAFDRPTQIRRGVGTALMNQTTFAYDQFNRTITTTRDRSSFNDPNPLKSQTVYDSFGRTIEKRQYESASTFITIKLEYDALGRAVRNSNPYRAGEPIVWTTTVFDALNRVTSVTTPDNAVATTSYSGNTSTIADQNNKQRKSVADGLGRLVQIVEDPAGLNYLTSYGYDVLDNLTSVTQGTQTRTYVYDSLKRLSSAANPESGTVSFVYDNNGNIQQKTDARGISITYAYDALNRNTTMDYSNTAINPDITNAYDGATNGKGRFWFSYAGGNASSGTTVEHTVIDNYDLLGRPTVQRQVFKSFNVWGSPFQISRSYNLADAVVSQTYPSGRAVQYTYDNAGRTSSFSGNLGNGTQRTYASGIVYSPFGGVAQEQFGTSVPLYNKAFYNSRAQLSEIRVGLTANDTSWNRGAIINHYSFLCWGACNGTDNNGTLKKQEFYIPNNDQVSSYVSWFQQYDYDSLNRLLRVHEYTGNPALDWQQEFVYDRFGNRTIHQTNTFGAGINKRAFTVSTVNNRLGVPSGQPGLMTYDNAGNLTDDSYTGSGLRNYDAQNRMIAAGNQLEHVYTYNAAGRRTRRNSNGSESWQIYGFDGELVAEYAVSFKNVFGTIVVTPKVTNEYGYRNGDLLITTSFDNSYNPLWLVTDHLGTPRMVFDTSGSLAATKRHDYLPFGEELFAGQGVRTTVQGYSGIDNIRQHFTGKERDIETGLDFFEARYFASIQGRFTSADPIFMAKERTIDPQQMNLYAYVRNNPLAFIDPDGEYFVGTDGKKVDVKVKDGKISVSPNASPDLRRMAALVEKSGSKTAASELKKVAQNDTKVNFKIETQPVTNGLRGYHQAHDKNGNALEWDAAAGRFKGEAAFTKDNKGYAEATITVYEGNMSGTPQEIEDNLVSTFAHEMKHDTDKESIKAIKDRQEGKKNDYDVEAPAYQLDKQVQKEIDENRQKKPKKP